MRPAVVKTLDGYEVQVDDDVLELFRALRWRVIESGGKPYAYAYMRGSTTKITLMHRAVFGAQQGQRVHHLNGDTLDNRRENLIDSKLAPYCTIAFGKVVARNRSREHRS